MELSAQSGYVGPEPLPGYPVNVAIPTGNVRKRSENLMWSGKWLPCMCSFNMCVCAFSPLTLLVGGQEGHPALKMWGYGGGGHWLVRTEWCPAGLSVCLPLLIFPCTIKSRSSLLAPAHLGGRGKGPLSSSNVCVCVVRDDMPRGGHVLLGGLGAGSRRGDLSVNPGRFVRRLLRARGGRLSAGRTQSPVTRHTGL